MIGNTNGQIISKEQADLVKSEWKKTLNLWDEVWQLGTLNTSTGAIETDNTRIVSVDYIPIKPNTTYSITGVSDGRTVFYNADKSFNSLSGSAISSHQFTTPANAYYMRFSPVSSYGTTYQNNIMLNEGATAYPYQAYNGAIVHEKQLAEQKVSAVEHSVNQLVNGFTGWTTTNASASVSGDTATMLASAQNGQYGGSISVPQNHICYVKADIKLTTGTTDVKLRLSGVNIASTISTTNWQKVDVVAQNYSANASLYIRDERTSFDNIQIKNVILIDLTAEWGSGNEPSLDVCKMIYTNEYYPYGTSTISVLKDVKPIASYQTPVTAKVVSFNQLMKDFNNSGWGVNDGTMSVSNGVATFTATAQNGVMSIGINKTAGHKYYMRAQIKLTSYNSGIRLSSAGVQTGSFPTNTLDWQYLEAIATPTVTGATWYGIINTSSSNFDPVQVKNYIFIDLTAMGLDTLTLDQCKALFNADYYPYTSGTDMQLIQDGLGKIALCDMPSGYAKLDKVTTTTTYNQVYSKDANGNQSMINVANYVVSDAIVRRNGVKTIVALTPSDNNEASSKKYVDDLITKDFDTYENYTPTANWQQLTTLQLSAGTYIIQASTQWAEAKPTGILLVSGNVRSIREESGSAVDGYYGLSHQIITTSENAQTVLVWVKCATAAVNVQRMRYYIIKLR